MPDLPDLSACAQLPRSTSLEIDLLRAVFP
jgi:hypothetical protein